MTHDAAGDPPVGVDERADGFQGDLPPGVAAVLEGLERHDYLADEALATAVFLAMELRRPLFLEGDAGVGKTEVAKAVARWQGRTLLRLQCYEGIDASQALYDWDYPRQMLLVRGLTEGGMRDLTDGGHGQLDRQRLTQELYSPEFLISRPLLQAIDHGEEQAPVLLIDELDRSDDEFEAFLLEVLSDYSVTIPEIGTITADEPPFVVVTSNRTRDVHDALKRRCVYHWVEHPPFEREVRIVQRRAGTDEQLARDVARAVAHLRSLDLYKPPGVAETIEWARSLLALGRSQIDPATAELTLGQVLKYREDQQRVAEEGVAHLLEEVGASETA